MTRFCNDSLWDKSVTWDTSHPNFTACFQNTVLSFTPLVLLICVSPLEIFFSRQKKQPKIDWNIFNIGKILLVLSLVFASGFEVYLLLENYQVGSVDPVILAALSRGGSYLCSILLQIFSLRQVLIIDRAICNN